MVMYFKETEAAKILGVSMGTMMKLFLKGALIPELDIDGTMLYSYDSIKKVSVNADTAVDEVPTYSSFRYKWEDIQDLFHNLWVGLTDVEYEEDGKTIKSAIVKYTDKTESELRQLTIKEDIVAVLL